MEHEYFWGALKSLAKSVTRVAKKAMSSPLGGLNQKGLKMGMDVVGKKLPIFQALDGIIKLARGDLKGLLS